MKKFGFTLAEVLITMGIIGIVAAVAAPTLNAIVPDRNKAKVLKVYNIIQSINSTLLNNPSLYPGDGNDNCEGLACTSRPYDWENLLISKYPDITAANVNNFSNALSGNIKYLNLLAMNLEISTAHNNNTLYANGTNANFVTEDGLRWIIRANNTGTEAIIQIDTNDNGENNVGLGQTYTQNQQNPDRFSFLVDQFGKVRPNDALTEAYITNPKKLNDKTADYQKAATLAGPWHNF